MIHANTPQLKAYLEQNEIAHYLNDAGMLVIDSNYTAAIKADLNLTLIEDDKVNV